MVCKVLYEYFPCALNETKQIISLRSKVDVEILPQPGKEEKAS